MNFVSIRVSTLRGDLPIPFDAYIQINGKNILYCRKGDSFEGKRLDRLREKKLKKLYILDEHEKHYRTYLSQNIERAYESSKDLPMDTRASVVQGAQQAASEDLMENTDSETFYRVAQNGTNRYVDFLLKNQGAIKAVMNIENTNNEIGHHGVAVATIAIGIAEALKLNESHPFMVNELALGCMVHDIEHYFSGLQISRKLDSFTPEERKLYQNHPQAGLERVRQASHFDGLVLDIILQHEEKMNGSGFPKGLNEKQLDPFVLIASTANVYDRLVSFEKIEHKAALKSLLLSGLGLYPLPNLQALQSFLKAKSIIT